MLKYINLFKMMIGLSWWISMIHPASALLAYDCGGANLNFTRISATEVSDCVNKNETAEKTVQAIQVIQLKDEYDAKIQSCKIEVFRSITYCGMSSHNSIVKSGYLTYIYRVGREECMKAIGTGQLGITGGFKPIYVDNLRLNEEYRRAVTFSGTVNDEGKCTGGSYSDFTGSWESVLVTGWISVTLTEITGKVDPGRNRIHLPHGVSYMYSDMSGIDTTYGYIYWTQSSSMTCNTKTLAVLYQGRAEIYSPNNATLGGAMVVVDSATHLFSFTLKTTRSICGNTAYSTEHPAVLIIPRTLNNEFNIDAQTTTADSLDLLLYINAKFVYMEKSMKWNSENLYQKLRYTQCLMMKKLLETQLAIAISDPHTFAYRYMNKPGYAGRILGEVVYVIECAPVEVVIRTTDLCYNEIPVNHSGKDMFMLPMTGLLQQTGSQIECSNVYYAAYNIEGRWISVHHGARETTLPVILDPNTPDDWTFVQASSIGTKGIYTEAEVNKMRDQIMYGSEREAITSNVMRAYTGQATAKQGGSILNLLDETDEVKLLHNLSTRLLSWFHTLGEGSSLIVVGYYIYMLLHYLVTVGFNFKNLEDIVFGCKRMLIALIPPLAQFTLHQKHKGVRRGANSEELLLSTLKKDLGRVESGPDSHNSLRRRTPSNEDDMVIFEKGVHPSAPYKSLEDEL